MNEKIEQFWLMSFPKGNKNFEQLLLVLMCLNDNGFSNLSKCMKLPKYNLIME